MLKLGTIKTTPFLSISGNLDWKNKAGLGSRNLSAGATGHDLCGCDGHGIDGGSSTAFENMVLEKYDET